MCSILLRAFDTGDGICSASMSVKPQNSPKNLAQTKRNNGLMFNFNSDFVNFIPSSAKVSANVESASPTVLKKRKHYK